MSWTAPRTWATNEVVTSTIMNTHVRDNELSLMHLLDLQTADVDVVSTTSETSLHSIVVPANALTSTGHVNLELQGDMLYNNTTSDTVVFRIKFGGVTHITTASLGFGNSTNATRGGWSLVAQVWNKGATNSQFVTMLFQGTTYGSGGNGGQYFGTPAIGSIDTTADQTFQVTAQLSASSANFSVRKRVSRSMIGQN